jgi:hypothetical protein
MSRAEEEPGLWNQQRLGDETRDNLKYTMVTYNSRLFREIIGWYSTRWNL